MLESAKITLIVPVYNGATYLRALLETVQAQTFTQWVCLCVNDGSTDHSREIIDAFIRDDPRFQVIDKTNGGTGDSRNTGLAHAKTPYVMFSDQDDWIHPQSFETAYSLIESSGADILTFERAQIFYGSYFPEPLRPDNLKVIPLAIDPKDQFLLYSTRYSSFVWQRIFRRAAIAGVWFPKTSGGEDLVYMLELSFRVKKWVSCSAVLYGTRENRNSVSRTVSPRYLESVFSGFDEMRNRMIQYSINALLQQQFLTRSMFWFSAVAILFNGRKRAAIQTFSKLTELVRTRQEQNFFEPKVPVCYRWLFFCLKTRWYFPLRCFAWSFALYFARDRIRNMIAHYLFRRDGV